MEMNMKSDVEIQINYEKILIKGKINEADL